MPPNIFGQRRQKRESRTILRFSRGLRPLGVGFRYANRLLIKADKTARITADAAKQSADAATQAANATLGLERPFFHILNVELIGEGATMYLT